MTSWAGLTVHIHRAYVQVVFILLQEVMEITMVNQLPLDHELRLKSYLLIDNHPTEVKWTVTLQTYYVLDIV